MRAGCSLLDRLYATDHSVWLSPRYATFRALPRLSVNETGMVVLLSQYVESSLSSNADAGCPLADADALAVIVALSYTFSRVLPVTTLNTVSYGSHAVTPLIVMVPLDWVKLNGVPVRRSVT